MENIIRVKNGESIKEAQLKARALKEATVIVEEGVYHETLILDKNDSGTKYIGINATVSGGFEVEFNELQKISDDIKERLSIDAKEKVKLINLKKYGFSEKDWGEIYPIGDYQTGRLYPNVKLGSNFEVFSGGKRMSLARYPNSGYVKLAGVKEHGEYPGYYEKEIKYRKGGTYLVDNEVNSRIKNWKNPETAWMFGYFPNDWADASTPIKVNPEKNEVYPEFVSVAECKENADYYLFNVLEELDAPGEYFLDRESGELYLYPINEGDKIEISFTEEPVIKAEGVQNLTVEGFILKNSRSHAIDIKGNNCVLKNLLVKNVAEHGIVAEGYKNRIENCEITATGKGGILLTGGDRDNLTPGENLAYNNYVHDFSEVYQTYQPGIGLYGVGNIASRNEISYTPHYAIYYRGNEHVIEYNYIHHAVLYSADAGAIYAGFDWAACGTIVRNNLIKDIGSEFLHPNGIYWDDALSGQTAYGNILIDIPQRAFHIGGGRNNTVTNNLIIDGGVTIGYDARAYEGFFENGWYNKHVITKDGLEWQKLFALPFNSEIWVNKYPYMGELITDFDKCEDVNFPVHPANAVVKNNIIIKKESMGLDIHNKVEEYGEIENNIWFETLEEASFDIDTLKFINKPEFFPEIPVEKIGRIK